MRSVSYVGVYSWVKICFLLLLLIVCTVLPIANNGFIGWGFVFVILR